LRFGVGEHLLQSRQTRLHRVAEALLLVAQDGRDVVVALHEFGVLLAQRVDDGGHKVSEKRLLDAQNALPAQNRATDDTPQHIAAPFVLGG
jgi:hypothetical protein